MPNMMEICEQLSNL